MPYLRPSFAICTRRSVVARAIGSTGSAGQTLCASSITSSTGCRCFAACPEVVEDGHRDGQTLARMLEPAHVDDGRAGQRVERREDGLLVACPDVPPEHAEVLDALSQLSLVGVVRGVQAGR